MSRKTKILFIIICVAVGVGFIAAWSGDDKGELKVTVFPAPSNQVSLLITNNSTNSVQYYFYVRELSEQQIHALPSYDGRIAHHSARIVEMPGYSTNRWTFQIAYAPLGGYGSKPGLMEKAIAFASKHNWNGIARRMNPRSTIKTIFGPIMLGNQPAPSPNP